MKFKALCLSSLIALTFAAQSAYGAATHAVQEMAQILISMKTAPDSKQRETLSVLSESQSVTSNEQNLAKAILNINSSLRSEDKKLVWNVLRSISAAEGERELAKVVNGFHDQANEGQKKRLAKLLPRPQKKSK